MKFLILLITFPFFLSCAKNNQANNSRLYLDNMENLSPELQSKVIYAIQTINSDAQGELISFQKKESNLRPLVLISGFSPETLAHAQSLEYRCLISLNQSNPVVNNTNPIQTDLRFVLLHEIGHCYNLGHDDSSIYNIMNSFYSGVDNFTAGEVNIILNNIKSFSSFLFQQSP